MYQTFSNIHVQLPPFDRLCQPAMFISRVAACRSDFQAAAPIDHVGAITSLTMELCNFGSILAAEMVPSSSSSSMEEGYLRLLSPAPLPLVAWRGQPYLRYLIATAAQKNSATNPVIRHLVTPKMARNSQPTFRPPWWCEVSAIRHMSIQKGSWMSYLLCHIAWIRLKV